MKIISTFLIVATILTFSPDLKADENDDFVSYPLHVSVPLTSAALGTWLALEIFKKDLAPDKCNWCSENFIDEGAKSGLKWNRSNWKKAHMLSNIALGALGGWSLAQLGLLTGEAGFPSGTEQWQPVVKSGLVLLETVSLSLILNQVVKYAVARRRPCGNYCDFSSQPSTDRDNNLSFYSGHTSTAFALATASAVMVDMSGSSYTPWVVATNFFLASLVGYFRIAANKHYLSDVLIGALVGSAIGYVVPKYLHKVDDKNSDQKKAQYWLGYQQNPSVFMFNFSLPL